jgi:hypothetical protein
MAGTPPKGLQCIQMCPQLLKLSVKSPVFTFPFTLYPLFQWYPQSKEILLNLSIFMWLHFFFSCSWNATLFRNKMRIVVKWNFVIEFKNTSCKQIDVSCQGRCIIGKLCNWYCTPCKLLTPPFRVNVVVTSCFQLRGHLCPCLICLIPFDMTT